MKKDPVTTIKQWIVDTTWTCQLGALYYTMGKQVKQKVSRSITHPWSAGRLQLPFLLTPLKNWNVFGNSNGESKRETSKMTQQIAVESKTPCQWYLNVVIPMASKKDASSLIEGCKVRPIIREQRGSRFRKERERRVLDKKMRLYPRRLSNFKRRRPGSKEENCLHISNNLIYA
jgi:hypothetical protein